MRGPTFSIITVSYNSSKTISQTIESVMHQSYSDFEYILVDGASTDGTAEIVKKYAERYPDKIRYISEPDHGIYDAMNKGIRMSRGKIIGILNSDDWYEENALAEVVPMIPQEEEYVLYGMVRFWNNEIEERVLLNRHEFLSVRMMMHPACFVSKATYRKYGRYNEKYHSAADYDCLLRFQKHHVPFIPIYKILANYRVGGTSTNYISYKETNSILRKYGYLSLKRYAIRSFTNWVKYGLLGMKEVGVLQK